MGFAWEDGERLIRFGPGVAARAPEMLAEHGFVGYALLAGERTLALSPALADGAAVVVRVPSGPVAEAARAVLDGAHGRPVVGLGGGRVVDTAKSVAAVNGLGCAAIPTTLSGAELSRRHRLPEGFEDRPLVRPSLVIADPRLMASQPTADLAASAMNALGHALEALYVPSANPVATLAALEGAASIARGLAPEQPARDEVALGSLLAGYALGATGLALHHVVCQTLVGLAGSPHAATNAVMLPHSVRLMAPRAPRVLGRFAEALGARSPDPAAAPDLVTPLAARSGLSALSQLGVELELLPAVARAALGRDELAHTPSAPDESELLALLRAAF